MHNLVASYFCFGFGGSSSADYLINSGTPMNLMSSRDIGFYWFLSYLAVYWSPFDLVYRLGQWPRSPTRIALRVMEGIDIVTTCTARVDKAILYMPGSRVAPFLAGFITWVTGSFFRTLEQRGRDGPTTAHPKFWWCTPGLYGGVCRGIIFTTTYYVFGKLIRGGLYEEVVRLWCTTAFVALDVMEELVPAFDPFSVASRALSGVLTLVARLLWLGKFSHPKVKVSSEVVARDD